MILTDAQPLITNDWSGFAKLVTALAMGELPVFGIIIAFLRKGPNDAIAEQRRQLNGYGERLNTVEKTHAADQQEVGQLEIRMARSEQDREVLHEAHARIEARVSANDRRIEENQRAILDAAHKIELQVASLAAKADIGKELRDGLDRIADLMEKRDQRHRANRGEVE